MAPGLLPKSVRTWLGVVEDRGRCSVVSWWLCMQGTAWCIGEDTELEWLCKELEKRYDLTNRTRCVRKGWGTRSTCIVFFGGEQSEFSGAVTLSVSGIC